MVTSSNVRRTPIAINGEWGTFKDSSRAPVHRWFTYPAGFSYRAVQYNLNLHDIIPGMTVYDPFAGSGTTNLTAKSNGIESIGVEAHFFVHRIAKTKLNWSVNEKFVLDSIADLAKKEKKGHEYKGHEVPELLKKCYETKTLNKLFFIRDAVNDIKPKSVCDFLKVALISTLRRASSVETGWPYIAPNKARKNLSLKPTFSIFEEQVLMMLNDLRKIRSEATEGSSTKSKMILGDARNTRKHIHDASVDHVFTSPPYLNNYDYADRTRLEMYFMGDAQHWGDITRLVRKKLITAATTQISRRDTQHYKISSEIHSCAPSVGEFLEKAIVKLNSKRLEKRGKKNYDLMVAGYFNDVFCSLTDVYRVLKPGKIGTFILGDSAPYGIHIPTDEIVGKLAIGAGFKDYNITPLRIRGNKWRNNPQRHSVMLRESMLSLYR